MGLWVVPPIWRGETVFIIGGGTSVEAQNVSRLEGRKVIAVNSSFEVAPFAQYLFFGDKRWWDENQQRLAGFAGQIVTKSANSQGERLLKLRQIMPSRACGLVTTNRSAVACDKTSLQGAMNLAFHLGATRMVLLGADGCRAADGRTHHHTPHRWKNKPGNASWDRQMEDLRFIVDPLKAHDVEVLNASPISRFPYWPLVDFESLAAAPVAAQ